MLDENNAPIANVGIYASSGMQGDFLSGTNTDGGGNFDISVFGGTWNLGLSNIEGLGLIFLGGAGLSVSGVIVAGLTHHERVAWSCTLVLAALGVALLVERGHAFA